MIVVLVQFLLSPENISIYLTLVPSIIQQLYLPIFSNEISLKICDPIASHSSIHETMSHPLAQNPDPNEQEQHPIMIIMQT